MTTPKKIYHHNAMTLFASREITEYDVLKKDMKVMHAMLLLLIHI